MKTKHLIILGVVVIALMFSFLGGGDNPGTGEVVSGFSGSLTVAGSTTVLPINQEAARVLMEKHDDLRISVSGGGSGHGIRAVGSGEADIGAASREVKKEEKQQYSNINPIAIGKDSVAVAVHPLNDIDELSIEQVRKIFSGEITNWQTLGGGDREIRVVTREPGSGTREVFENSVMKDTQIAERAGVKSSNGEVRASIATDENKIGYVSYGYIDDSVKSLKIQGTTPDDIKDYPISRSLFLITKGEPKGLEEKFLDFVLSPEGQEIVKEIGYMKVNQG